MSDITDRVKRAKTFKEAITLANNAKRHGDLDLESAAIQYGFTLRALEDGYVSPAEVAIAEALYTYEMEMTKTKGRNFYAGRTRKMLKQHGALIAAERMVITPKKSTGYIALEEVGLKNISFESIVSRFPDEFSSDAVKAAQARLDGTLYSPEKVRQSKGSFQFDDYTEVLIKAQKNAIDKFDSSKNEIGTWGKRDRVQVEGLTKKSGIAFKNPDNPNPAIKAQYLSMRFGKRVVLIEWIQQKHDEPPRIYVISEAGQTSTVSTKGTPYESKFFHKIGRRSVVGNYSLQEGTQAIEKYLAELDDFAPKKRAPDSDSVTSQKTHLAASDFTKALIKADLTEGDRRWVVAHFYSQDFTTSMEEIAELLGYTSFKAGNSQYGTAAGKIAKATGVVSEDLADGPYSQNMQWLAITVGRNLSEHHQWQMRPELREALLHLSWVELQEANTEIDADAPSEDEKKEAQEYGLSDTEVRQMMLSRKGQGRFRKSVLSYWGSACAVSGLQLTKFLVASHIKPWKDCNPNERLNGFNGLPLSPNLDKAFDRGLITFDENGRIRISDQLSKENCQALGINEQMSLRMTDARIESFLIFHRKQLFKEKFTV